MDDKMGIEAVLAKIAARRRSDSGEEKQPLTADDKQNAKCTSQSQPAAPAGSVEHKSVFEARVSSVSVESMPDEVEKIVAIWRALLGLKLDREKVGNHLAALRRWARTLSGDFR
jgi:hypothetical protein